MQMRQRLAFNQLPFAHCVARAKVLQKKKRIFFLLSLPRLAMFFKEPSYSAAYII